MRIASYVVGIEKVWLDVMAGDQWTFCKMAVVLGWDFGLGWTGRVCVWLVCADEIPWNEWSESKLILQEDYTLKEVKSIEGIAYMKIVFCFLLCFGLWGFFFGLFVVGFWNYVRASLLTGPYETTGCSSEST